MHSFIHLFILQAKAHSHIQTETSTKAAGLETSVMVSDLFGSTTKGGTCCSTTAYGRMTCPMDKARLWIPMDTCIKVIFRVVEGTGGGGRCMTMMVVRMVWEVRMVTFMRVNGWRI